MDTVDRATTEHFRMDPRQLVDAQFNRAVEIVQSLPKTGPIQTGYEEKLTMYSLYKQATVGNVTTSRPGMFDMLGRAKWDAWAKHRDLDQYDAKSLYVDALLKALNKYSDKTVARDLIDELRSFGGVSESLVSTFTLTRSASRSTPSSTSSADDSPIPSSRLQDFQHSSIRQRFRSAPEDDTFDDDEEADETRDLPAVSQQQRPSSSISFSSRYKTPLTGSYALPPSPPRKTSLPPVQPLPTFETPSAFADPPRATSVSTYTASYAASLRDVPPQMQSSAPPYRSHPLSSRHNTATTAHLRPSSRAVSVSLEHAMENMQAHLAALTERVDTLELAQSQPQAQASPSRTSSGRGSPAGSRSVCQPVGWDVDDMGLWTLVLKPLCRNLSLVQRLLVFFLKSGHDRSPLLIVIRRLCLDVSFLMVLIGVLRSAWIKSDARRKEVAAALVVLWGAVTGKRQIPGRRHLRL